MKKSAFFLCASFIWPLWLALFTPCFSQALNCSTIYDYENKGELSGLYYQCHTWYELDSEHATSGAKSLRVEMYPPGNFPGLRLKDLKGPWENVHQIRLDIFNPLKRPLPVTVRIDDRDKSPPYADRINHTVLLRPGTNKVILDLDRLTTSGTGRHLVPKRIVAFMLFVDHPKAPVTIFVDNIRVCKEK